MVVTNDRIYISIQLSKAYGVSRLQSLQLLQLILLIFNSRSDTSFLRHSHHRLPFRNHMDGIDLELINVGEFLSGVHM